MPRAPKHPRAPKGKSLTLEQRRQVREWAFGQDPRPVYSKIIDWVWEKFEIKITKFTVSKYLSNDYKVLDGADPATTPGLNLARKAEPLMPHLERVLRGWEIGMEAGDEAPTKDALRQKAREIYDKFPNLRNGVAPEKATFGDSWARAYKKRWHNPDENPVSTPKSTPKSTSKTRSKSAQKNATPQDPISQESTLPYPVPQESAPQDSNLQYPAPEDLAPDAVPQHANIQHSIPQSTDHQHSGPHHPGLPPLGPQNPVPDESAIDPNLERQPHPAFDDSNLSALHFEAMVPSHHGFDETSMMPDYGMPSHHLHDDAVHEAA